MSSAVRQVPHSRVPCSRTHEIYIFLQTICRRCAHIFSKSSRQSATLLTRRLLQNRAEFSCNNFSLRSRSAASGYKTVAFGAYQGWSDRASQRRKNWGCFRRLVTCGACSRIDQKYERGKNNTRNALSAYAMAREENEKERHMCI